MRACLPAIACMPAQSAQALVHECVCPAHGAAQHGVMVCSVVVWWYATLRCLQVVVGAAQHGAPVGRVQRQPAEYRVHLRVPDRAVDRIDKPVAKRRMDRKHTHTHARARARAQAGGRRNGVDYTSRVRATASISTTYSAVLQADCQDVSGVIIRYWTYSHSAASTAARWACSSDAIV